MHTGGVWGVCRGDGVHGGQRQGAPGHFLENAAVWAWWSPDNWHTPSTHCHTTGELPSGVLHQILANVSHVHDDTCKVHIDT